MTWVKNFIRITKFKWTSCNQYGNRYKADSVKRLSVAKLQCEISDEDGIQKLVLLSNTLDVPIRYDWNDHEAYIEVVSHEALKECTW